VAGGGLNITNHKDQILIKANFQINTHMRRTIAVVLPKA
jgi:hypothetical protein